MPEIICHECEKKGKIRQDHTSINHRTWKWHSIIILMLGLSITLAYVKNLTLSIILIGYTYLTIIMTTKGKQK